MDTEIKKVATRLINKVLIVPNDVAAGVGKINQVRASGEVEVPLFNPTFFKGNLVVDKYEDLINPNKINPEHLGETKVAFVVDKGLLYKYNDITRTWDITSSNMPTISSVEDLVKEPEGNYYVVVTDSIRGGVFVYDEKYKNINNQGTIINGWVRQYAGGADVKWFGAIGNGVIDDTKAIQQALKSCKLVLITEGNYKISKTLEVPNDVYIKGTGGRVLGEGDITFFKLNLRNKISDLEIHGDTSKINQVAILIDGGDTLNNCQDTLLDNVTITTIGGYGVKIVNTGDTEHLIVNSKFLNCNYGIGIELTGKGLSVTNSYFYTSRIALQIKGVKANFTSCVFVNNASALNFLEGISSENANIEFNMCRFFNNSNADLVSKTYQSLNVIFNSCSFNENIYMFNTNSFQFYDCVFNSSEVRFTDSNDSVFKNCKLIRAKVTNDYNYTKTLNYWYDCQEIEMLTPTKCTNGGYLEVVHTEDFNISNEQVIRVVPFNTIVANKMPYHDNFTKYSFFDKSYNCFDFTQTKTADDFIHGDITICTNVDQTLLSLYLYRVDTNSDEPTLLTFDLGRAETGILWLHSGFTVDYKMYCGTFKIPRGKYKLIYANANTAGKFYKHNQTFRTNSRLVYRARFWGI